jgi:hypothetical protein
MTDEDDTQTEQEADEGKVIEADDRLIDDVDDVIDPREKVGGADA